MSSKKSRPFRVGDRVRIINPRFVVRVGYPKCVADYLPVIHKNFQEIDTLLRKMEGQESRILHIYCSCSSKAKASKLEWALACELAKRDGFGGRERTLHWEEYPSLEGRETYVESVRSVQTGTYHPGEGMRSWDGEYDYVPAYLDNIKVYRLIKLQLGICMGNEGAPCTCKIFALKEFKTTPENLLLVEDSSVAEEDL